MFARPLVILACLLLTGVYASAQSAAPGASSGASAPSSVRQKPAATQRPPSAKTGQPNVANLTKQECRKLGGTLQDDTKCKNAKRCVITLASGDVNSICIDEVK
jgi:hypothetical protein